VSFIMAFIRLQKATAQEAVAAAAAGLESDAAEDRRWMTVMEIIEAEAKYVNNLHIVVDRFYRPLVNMVSLGVITMEQVQRIFSNIQDLAQFHDVFLAELQSLQKPLGVAGM
jgi:RhoGEF domain